MKSETCVETPVYNCRKCDTLRTTSHHADPSCGGVIIYVGNKWICGQCGIQIDIRTKCDECGASLTVKRRSVPIDTSPDVLPATVEQAIHKQVNKCRTENSCPRLSYDFHLAGIAREHSRSMSTREFFSHETPCEMSVADRYDRANYQWRTCAENIAFRHPSSLRDAEVIATEFVNGWFESPGHRENLLKSEFTVEGIGVYYASDGSVFVTQNFA